MQSNRANVRMCRVSFTYTKGLANSVRVSAASLVEAAALGLAEFRKCEMMETALRRSEAVHSSGGLTGKRSRTTDAAACSVAGAWREDPGRTGDESASKELLGQ